MSTSVMQMSVSADANGFGGELFNPAGGASIEFFNSAPVQVHSSHIALSASGGLNANAFHAVQLPGVGELHCAEQACVSHFSVADSANYQADLNAAVLANTVIPTMQDNQGDQASFQAIQQDLLSALPQVRHALEGGLSPAELGQLIADLQTQVLELNSLTQNLFGDLSAEVGQASTEVNGFDTDSLIASLQLDSGLLAQPEALAHAPALAFEATLDGLFTAPEAFPLTLDFSSPNSIQEASELFAWTGNSSSINSTATDSSTPDSGSTSSDYS